MLHALSSIPMSTVSLGVFMFLSLFFYVFLCVAVGVRLLGLGFRKNGAKWKPAST